MKRLLLLIFLFLGFLFFVSAGNAYAKGKCGFNEHIVPACGTLPANPPSCNKDSECCTKVCVPSSPEITTETQCNGSQACLQALAKARAIALDSDHGWFVHKRDDGSYIVVCDNNWIEETFRDPSITPTPSAPPACNAPCPNNDYCQSAKDGCTVCSSDKKCVAPSPTPIPPACNVKCSIPADCTAAKDGCTTCIGGICQPVPTPTATPVPTKIPDACNVTCTRDADCQADVYSSTNQCTACVGGTCKVPPACNVACSTDFDCAGAKDGCTVCLPNASGGKVCKTPPACNVTCSIPSDCAGAKDGCTLCGANNKCVPPPTPTPTPIPFNPDACKCDGIDYTALVSGQQATISSFAKVLAGDTANAKVESQVFTLYEGAETLAKIIEKSNPIPATIVSTDQEKTRYVSKWAINLPDLKPGATYRIQSVPNCVPKVQAFNFSSETTQKTPTKGILAAETSSSVFDIIGDSMANFLNFISFGLIPGAQKAPEPTPTPALDTVETFQDAPTPTRKSGLQLGTIYPAQVYQKTCSFIKFKFEGFK